MLTAPSPRDRRDLRFVILWIIAPLALAFLAAVMLVRYQGKSVAKLLSDPAAALHTNPLLGFVSNIGILGWCAGATVALFAAWLLHRARQAPEAARFHVGAGLFTALLMADDFFLIHDALAPRYLHLPQNVVYALYCALFALFVVRCRHALLARNPALFAAAVALLGLMAGLDALLPGYSPLASLVMSGSKFLGIFTWSAWLILAARHDLESVRSAPH